MALDSLKVAHWLFALFLPRDGRRGRFRESSLA